MKTRTSVKIALLLCALLFPLVHVAVFFHGNWYSFFHSYSLAMFFGLISFAYFSLALVLAARLRFFDHIFGHNRVIVFHGIIASLALVSGILHAILKFVYFPDPTLQSALGIAGLIIFIVIIKLTFIYMVPGPFLRWPLTGTLIRKISGSVRIDYSFMKMLHNLSAPAFVLITIHVMLALPVQETTSRTLICSFSGIAAITLYLYHAILRPVLRRLGARPVIKATKLSESIVEIEMNRGTLRHRAGQFAYFRFLSPLCGRAEHPFSISSAPSADTLSITVKALGDYTKKLFSLVPGTPVLIDGPYGVFTADNSSGPLLLLAGGIGITPFLSMIREFFISGTDRKITLVWSVLISDEAFALRELREAEKSLRNFTFILRVTGDTNPESGNKDGFVDETLLRKACDSNDIQRGEAFVCGPEPFMNAVQPMLRKLGYHRNRIHTERFSF